MRGKKREEKREWCSLKIESVAGRQMDWNLIRLYWLFVHLCVSVCMWLVVSLSKTSTERRLQRSFSAESKSVQEKGEALSVF